MSDYNTINSDLIRGHIDTIILKSLYERDRYGYDIIKEIEQKTGGTYKLKQPTLYSCLKRLEEQGFTSSYWGAKSMGGRKKYYTLTEMGKELFIKNQTDWMRSKSIIDKLMCDGAALDSDAFFESAGNSDSVISGNNSISGDINDGIGGFFDSTGGTDGNSKEEVFAFTQPTYELKEGTDILQEHTVRSEATPLPDFDSFYFSLKDKPSYTDEVASTDYQPRSIAKTEYSDTYIYEDELPYEQHAKQEYALEDGIEECASGEQESESVDCGVNELPSDLPQCEDPNYGYDMHELESPVLDEDLNSGNDSAIATAAADSYASAKSVSGEISATAAGSNSYAGSTTKTSASSTADNEFSGFLKYESGSIDRHKDSEIVAREYQGALSRLVKAQKARYSDDPYLQSKLEKTAANTKQMGDDVIIRKHTDSLRKYNSENYIFASRLRLIHYMIMFLIMLVETVFAFLIFEVSSHKGVITARDGGVYIAGVVVALIFPLAAFLMAYLDLGKRKKIEFDFKSSLYFRIIVSVLLMFITFAVNIYLRILGGQFTDYLATLMYPIIMSTNVVVSLFVYNALLNSKKYNCQ